ncbi:hypothetical protein SARC_05999 [Sphaeroforma arctica JP610]|uniref:AB hydrolase-1 domain-containing protein n=1 Tax=Sphaeroforma arctica JP610 TaxID=667725 RepID=A0A0L0FYJ1_9EUKA|nr:hypothetical protein SARC_05999 [Sphaeroforma arctica JP610]KNC81689.1 hypothetical protein SARC_05999 [Sphaeroforma arctica JP610]|eukprot:XP_014155591.1 hypothetical protein SARC_05999 [Sphaeroforma arctica JP610]
MNSPRSTAALKQAVPLAANVFRNELSKLPPVVIVHGLFGSSQNWKTVSKELAKDREVHAVGYLIFDILSFQGGKTAMVTALNHKELVRKVIVVDISPVSYRGSQTEMVSYAKALADLDLKSINSRKEAYDALKVDIPDDDHLQFMITNLVKTGDKEFKWRLNVNILPSLIPSFAKFPETVKNKPFDGLTLFLHGNKSRYYQPRFLPEIEALFSNYEIKGLDAGHWVHADAPEAFLVEAKRFLD